MVALSPEDRAHLCQAAEDHFSQVHYGIADKFVISCAQKESALFVNCQNCTGEYVPFDNSDVSVIICNSGAKPKPISGKQIISLLQTKYPEIQSLCDVTTNHIESMKDTLGDKLYSVAFHMVTENQRTMECKDALLHNDYDRLGALLMESHASFRDILNASSWEIDTLVELAIEQPGVYGARMNEEGNVILLVQRSQEVSVMKVIMQEYKERTGKECTMVTCYMCEGARIVTAEEMKAKASALWKRPWVWACAATAVSIGVMILVRSRRH